MKFFCLKQESEPPRAGANPIWSEPDSAPGPKDRKIEAGDKNKYFWHRNTSINT